MEPGENLEETARRETREETDLEIGEISLFGVFSGPELYYKYPNGAEVYNVSVVYATREMFGEVRIDQNEHTEMQYFKIDDIPEKLSPPNKPIIDRL
jgi:ADP-ribose pyrophosphatase YjhB (NUDIX family)